MPDRTTQTELDKFGALIDMILDDGSTPAGELPPAKHLAALQELDDIDRQRIEEVRTAHAEARGPPERNTGGQ